MTYSRRAFIRRAIAAGTVASAPGAFAAPAHGLNRAEQDPKISALDHVAIPIERVKEMASFYRALGFLVRETDRRVFDSLRGTRRSISTVPPVGGTRRVGSALLQRYRPAATSVGCGKARVRSSLPRSIGREPKSRPKEKGTVGVSAVLRAVRVSTSAIPTAICSNSCATCRGGVLTFRLAVAIRSAA